MILIKNYTIKHNNDVKLLMAGDDCGKILYGKIFELLQSDQFLQKLKIGLNGLCNK